MRTKGLSTISLGVMCAAISMAPASHADFANAAGQPVQLSKSRTIANFQSTNPRAGLALRDDNSIGRVYGKAFSHGQTGAISAQNFLDQNLAMWGVPAIDLVAEGPFDDGHHTQQIGYLADVDFYKFTGHYYKQIVDGVPVFRSKLILLTRNESNNPLVLASSELRDLGDFQMDAQVKASPINHRQIVQNAIQAFNPGIILDSSERVIYAGTETSPHAPTLADKSTVIVDGFEEFLVITDAATGKVLYTENLYCQIDVTGNASGMASDGPGADICATEIVQPLPYLNVSITGGNTAQTDINGDFTIPHGGSANVTVGANLTGQWFRVNNAAAESVVVSPPGPANLMFNALNNNASIRAQANAYVEANRVRDFVVAANPSYPQMMQSQFPINVNLSSGYCPGNAWYDGGSINFCSSGGGYPNTAWSSVIHHEYGHHLVNVAGSGQGQYGEGMGDVMSSIILDDSRLGLGFFGNCNSSLRNADNNHQYPCTGAIHDCGQLISGCVWDTREALVFTEPANYTSILNFLAVNAMLVHTGETITPQITIDWLTLDDNDGDIGNGTPHYNEIAVGFGAHNMDAPALNLINITYPAGQPAYVSPDGGTAMTVDLVALTGSLDPSSPTLFADTGAGYMSYPMSHVSGTEFEAIFPANTCGWRIDYYISAQIMSGGTATSPSGAPVDGNFSTTSAFAAPVVLVTDNFEIDNGWTVSGNASDGQWSRGIPVNCSSRGAPGSDSDGSGQCWVTDNNAANTCNSDVDNGTTTLTSPIFDMTGGGEFSFDYWFSDIPSGAINGDEWAVDVSTNGGSSWTRIRTVTSVVQAWRSDTISVGQEVAATSTMRFRFSANDVGTQNVIEAGLDNILITQFDCTGNPCPADMNGDGILDFFDVSGYMTAFGAGDPAADFTGDGTFDFFDVSAFLSAFAAGCP